jgi:hypothetical protein
MFPTFITIDSGDITTIIGHAHDLLTDLHDLLLVVVGVAVGLIIFLAIMAAIRR